MKIKDETFPSMTFEEFCEANNIEVVVRERPGEVLGSLRRYCVTFKGVEIMDESGLSYRVLGSGSTKEAAIDDYSLNLMGRTLVFDAGTSYERELQCPNVWLE
jgi:hypothetical protein